MLFEVVSNLFYVVSPFLDVFNCSRLFLCRSKVVLVFGGL